MMALGVFAYSGNNWNRPIMFLGNKNFFMVGLERYEHLIFLFMFAATSTTIVARTVAERCRMAAYLGYAILMTGFVYLMIAHAIWSKNGFLSIKLNKPFFEQVC